MFLVDLEWMHRFRQVCCPLFWQQQQLIPDGVQLDQLPPENSGKTQDALLPLTNERLLLPRNESKS
jgi:hypothetical protein